jgi:hypothetical protein
MGRAAGTWGVRFEFDDGTAGYAYSITKEAAEWDAHDRIGEELPVGASEANGAAGDAACARAGPWRSARPTAARLCVPQRVSRSRPRHASGPVGKSISAWS